MSSKHRNPSPLTDSLDSTCSMNDSSPVVLTVVDPSDARPELKQILMQRGYRVIDTDNGIDAAQYARQGQADLLVVDMDVPLLYELVAARQISRHAQVEAMPVVIVTHEDMVDPGPMMEIGASRNEFVTRLSDYRELKPLLDYLLPVLASTGGASSKQKALPASLMEYPPDISAQSVRELHPHRDVAFREPEVSSS
ncbi:MAG TPA: response regulator [Pyrinomonadaceae bacterium]|nr:response regulator [Pyrinomonadaceae bacterium]